MKVIHIAKYNKVIQFHVPDLNDGSWKRVILTVDVEVLTLAVGKTSVTGHIMWKRLTEYTQSPFKQRGHNQTNEMLLILIYLFIYFNLNLLMVNESSINFHPENSISQF